MATTLKGFTPWRGRDGRYYTGARQRYLIKNAYGTSLAKGDPVKVSNGYVELAVNGTAVAGVFDGCKYIDPTLLRSVESDLFVAGTSSGGLVEGQIHVLGFIVPASQYTFIAITDASVSAAAIGATYPVSVGTPNAQFKRSTARVNASVQVSADKNMVRLVGFPQISGSKADDTPTIVEVEFVTTGIVYA